MLAHLSASLSVFLSSYISVRLLACLPTCLPVYLLAFLPSCPSTFVLAYDLDAHRGWNCSKDLSGEVREGFIVFHFRGHAGLELPPHQLL